MITYSGIHIQKVGGVEGTPTVADIAVHSGRICRYGGALWYPLLTHSVFVGLLAYKRSNSIANLLWGFLHDTHEVVTSDVPRPFKCDCMRFEQNAIDSRLMSMFDLLPSMIDFELIKQCDTHALHIEAVELGLPNFAEIELAYASDYANETVIHNDSADKELFRRILASPFYTDTINGTQSLGVARFYKALQFAEEGNPPALLQTVRSWKLLEV